MNKFVSINSLLLFIMVSFGKNLHAQKHAIGQNDYMRGGGQYVSSASSTGVYIVLNTYNPSTTTIKNLKSDVEKVCTNHHAVKFSTDDRWAILIKADTLRLLELPSFKESTITNVANAEMMTMDGKSVLVYQTKNNQLIFDPLRTRKTTQFNNVLQFWQISENEYLLLKTDPQNPLLKKLLQVNLTTFKENEVWSNKKAPIDLEGVTIHRKTKTIAFFVSDTLREGEVSLYFHSGNYNKLIADWRGIDSITGKKFALTADPGFKFSPDASHLIVQLRDNTGKNLNKLGLKIWSYQDLRLKSNVVWKDPYGPSVTTKTALIGTRSAALTILGADNELIEIGYWELSQKDSIGLLTRWASDGSEIYWNKKARLQSSTLNLNTLKRDSIGSEWCRLSPNGRYCVWFDAEDYQYYAYDVARKTTQCITKSIEANWVNKETADLPKYGKAGYGVPGWSEDGQTVYLYDQYDIWAVSLTNTTPPRCLTNGFGAKNKISFRFADEERTIRIKRDMLVVSFDQMSKYNGFYKLSSTNDPVYLSDGPYLYFYPDHSLGKRPLKVYDDFYVVTRESEKEPSNCFLTKDFKQFKRLTNNRRNQDLNWLTSEVCNWYIGDTLHQAVMYKPENFDEGKKYPVIFFYYERLSHKAFEFKVPELSGGAINIPTYVSNGYIVVTVDIHYTIGEVGQSALHYVDAAANYFSKKPFINKDKMGLQGHSFGGFETNYIAVHSNRFAAACSAAGMSNLISDYGLVSHHGVQRAAYAEIGQVRLGTDPWTSPDIYVRNSPFLAASKLTTPLLMIHNERDGSVPFSQGLEFFNGLRRLGKRVWLLDYEKGDHFLYPGVVGLHDCDRRMFQFFDHYLKDAPAPLWMTTETGISDEDIERSLQPNTQITTPGKSLLNPDEQKRLIGL